MDSVLDVGCGTGGVTIPAANKKDQLKDLQIDFRSGVIEALLNPDASFDVVTSSLMMHHLPAHLQVTGLAEIYCVIEAGGLVDGRLESRI